MREAVIEGQTGILLRPGDVVGLAHAIERAMTLSDEEYAAMRAFCGEVYEAKFAPDRVKATLLEIVASLLATQEASETIERNSIPCA